MGVCCSCCGGEDAESAKEMELQAQRSKSLAISAKMSSPSIEISSSSVSGTGLALIGVPLEQDAAYWEWHVQLPPKTHVDTILFGVTHKKDRKFYKDQEDKVQPEEGERKVAGRIRRFANEKLGAKRGRCRISIQFFCRSLFIRIIRMTIAFSDSALFYFAQVFPLQQMVRIGCEKLKFRMEMW